MTRAAYTVTIATVAEDDLFDIVDYILVRERALAPALAVQNRIEATISSLTGVASRGRAPPELRDVGTVDIGFDFREIIDWPWRIVYRIAGRRVHVVMVLDGRRDADDLVRARAMRFSEEP